MDVAYQFLRRHEREFELMALDPSIILQAGRGVTPLMSNAEIEEQQAEREMRAMKMSQARQAMSDDNSLRQAYSAGGNIGQTLRQKGLYKPAMEYQKFQTEQQKAQADAEKAKLDTGIKHFEFVGQVMSGVNDQTTFDIARQRIGQRLGPEAMANIPAVYDPAAIARNQQQAMSVKDQMEQRLKALTAGETQRHNLATESNAAGSLNVAQGNLEVGRGNLSVNQQRFTADQNAPKGQVVQTADGPVIVDTRAGTSRPVMDAAGNPARRPGKDIPPNVNKSIIENQQNISKIDKAIAAISAKPSSLGAQYMVPGAETLGQYLDPEGVEARAGVADIGSLILHDRSGAAVTASETPRLRPFIPSASDSPDVAKKKLARFKAIYEEEAGLLAQTYSADQGYKESPALKAAPRRTDQTASNVNTPAATPAPAPARTVKRRGTLNGRKVVEYSDGSIDYAD
ncbi:hypothetical protein QFZ83_002161 [Variovorax sp. W1I1]|uniref:hypothetical protein n=1 Tax=Variovorax sp. W1I1 TaxID=3042309 RepID=UPI00277E9F88|nr:hypothetical protein [Variovorax sp. W1I1]MDQ0607990.1 hypothetical protein [Variovorax sp. W1I1]